MPPAIDTSAIADLARHEWALPVGNSAVSFGLLSFYLGAMWARTLPDGAASSRWAAWAMVGLGLGSIVVGQRLRVGWKRHVTAVLAALDRPPARGPHLRASNHQVNRRSWRRHAAHCRVRAAGPKHARP